MTGFESKRNMARGKGSPYYGKLMTDSLPSEVKLIWYSRDDELPELPRDGWSWEMETDMDHVERRQLLTKILTDAPLTDRQALVIELVVIEELMFVEIGLQIGVCGQRVRQIYGNAIRILRRHQQQFTGVPAFEVYDGVTSYRHGTWHRR